ncbi:MAG: TetR/AcrR family transcriptional regulator [Puniceicoccaceae bacterium]|nr:MAG: TetR/AcrR family transcriptional regulator [Puniceicoccaceae bacterium]
MKTEAAQSRRRRAPEATRLALVEATIDLVRTAGVHATTVDRICATAGVTKGAFFHYFPSKEDVLEAAILHWCQGRVELYGRDLGDTADDPLVRLERMLDGLAASVRVPGEKTACLLGMVAQELAGSNNRVRTLCERMLEGWTDFVAGLLAEAKRRHPPAVDFDPRDVAWMLNSLWQGSLLAAKTRRDPELVAANLEHARAYLSGFFDKRSPP